MGVQRPAAANRERLRLRKVQVAQRDDDLGFIFCDFNYGKHDVGQQDKRVELNEEAGHLEGKRDQLGRYTRKTRLRREKMQMRALLRRRS